MLNSYGSIASTSATGQTNTLSKLNAANSSAEVLSSFKDVFALMTLSSGVSGSSGQQGNSGVTEMMAPLMLILLEKLLELELDHPQAANEAISESNLLGTQGVKPEPSGLPVTGGWVTQEYHAGHHGLDIGIGVGTPVRTTMDGKVIHAGWNDQGYGNLVIVENGAYRTYYAHLSSIPVTVGETVRAGTTIGLSGNTGNSTGPHLHYEIRVNKVTVDPTTATLG